MNCASEKNKIGLILFTHPKLYQWFLSDDENEYTFGGIRYWQALRKILATKHNLECYNVSDALDKFIFLDMYRLKRVFNRQLFLSKSLWIIDERGLSSLTLDRIQTRNLCLILDFSNRSLKSWLRKLIFHNNINKVTKVVTISNFWKEYMMGKGFQNVSVIYNFFSFKNYEIGKQEVEKFKSKYGLFSKPIVYIGNCQEAKGVKEAYDALKDMDVHLVTSGMKTIELPCLHLNLNTDEYRCLLAASDVAVTMSKFEEGWCRTAHEAMLCKTPVIGSGLGGMKELLEGGGQLIVNDFKKLREAVTYLLSHPEFGEKGYYYATRNEFSYDYFQNAWEDLIDEVLHS
jgi:glycosyltransferase involved in cell wall biosynthesis